MVARYKIYRGRRPPEDPLPEGVRMDTRWRTRHILRPGQGMVETYLAAPSDAAWRTLSRSYRELLELRFREDRTPFDKLARLATDQDVFLGCNCPTQANPRVDRCHTVLALKFMKSKYRKLRVEMPG